MHAGWLAHPRPIGQDGRLVDHPMVECNIAFRLGVAKSDRLRGRDDLRDALTNTECTVRTPITLPGRGHISAATATLSKNRGEWPLGKVGHKSAYKSIRGYRAAESSG